MYRRQGSQVSMRVARGSASWLSSHGRGLGPRDALKKDSRGLSRVVSGEWFALEINRDHSVILEIAPKYCILDSFVDYEGYSISSKGFLSIVDIMVI